MNNPPESKEEDTEQDETPPNTEGVVIPEEFQKKVHALVHNAPKHHLEHIRDRVNDRQDEIRKEQREKEQKESGKGKKPNANIQFTTDDMPSTSSY